MENFDNYQKLEGVSQSHLKALLKSPQHYLGELEKERVWKRHFSLGSYLDAKLTGSEEEIQKNFGIVNSKVGEKPALALAIQQKDPERDLTDILNQVEYRTNITDSQKRIAKYHEETKEYQEYLSKGMIPVHINDILKGNALYHKVIESEIGQRLFKPTDLEEEEIQYQVALRVPYELQDLDFKVFLKGLLDVVVFNHTDKTVEIYDIKTTSDETPFHFDKIIRKYRYDFQLSFYKMLLEKTYPDYKIKKVSFLVVPINNFPVFLYTLSEFDLKVGKEGIVFNGYSYEGYEDALMRLARHQKSGEWKYPIGFFNGEMKCSTAFFNEDTISI